jgi:hypothetical protein
LPDSGAGLTPLDEPGSGLTPVPDSASGLTPLDNAASLSPIDSGGLTPVDGPSGLTPMDQGSSGLTPVSDGMSGLTPLGSGLESAGDPLGAPAAGLDGGAVNPYQSPSAAAMGMPKAKRRGSGFDFMDVLSCSWFTFWGNWVTCLLTALAVIGLAMVVWFAGGFLLFAVAMGFGWLAHTVGNQVFNIILAVLMLVLQVAIMAVIVAAYCSIYAGLIGMTTKMVRGESHSIGDVFSGGNNALRLFGFLLLQGLMQFVLGVIIGVVLGLPAALLDSMALNVLARLVAFAASMFVTLLLLLCPFLIVDRGAGVFDSIGDSVRYMAGKKLIVLGLIIVVGLGWFAFAVFTLGLGLLLAWLFPLIFMAVVYVKATGGRTAY